MEGTWVWPKLGHTVPNQYCFRSFRIVYTEKFGGCLQTRLKNTLWERLSWLDLKMTAGLKTDRQWSPSIERCTHVILQDSSIGESPVYTHPLVSFPSRILLDYLITKKKSNIHKLSWKLILHITFSIFGQPFGNCHSFSSRYPERLHWTARELLHPDPPVSS